MTDYKAKVDLDTTSLLGAAKAFSSTQYAINALSLLFRGEFVAAATQARAALIALRTAFLSNPFLAIAAGIAAVTAALAGMVIRRHTSEMKDLAEATKTYREELARIRGENETPGQRASRLSRKMLDGGDSDGLAKAQQKAEAQAALNDRAAAAMDEMAQRSSGLKKLTEKPRYEAEAARLRLEAEQLREAAGIYAEARNDLAEGKAKESADTMARGREFTEAAARTDLMRRMQGKTEEEKLQLQIDDANRRLRQSSRDYEQAKNDKDRYSAASAAEAISQEIITLNESLRGIKKQPTPTGGGKNGGLAEDNARYSFSRLSADAQLDGIRMRMREIAETKGWETNDKLGSEMLELRKMRDRLALSMKPSTAGRTVSGAGVEDQFANYRSGSGRADDVIRMRGSRAAGFIDDDGTRRLGGSIAGGFGDRLSQSRFATSRAELDARRAGADLMDSQGRKIMGRSSGDEQPVDIGSDALGYLRTIAENSGGI